MKRWLMIVAMTSLLMGVACSSDEGSSSGNSETTSGDAAVEAPFELSDDPVATTDVNLPKSYKFEPAVITIKAGDEVTWTNEDDFPHNVHLFDGDVTQDLPVGESTSMAFDDPGDYYYECSIHPQQMRGKIVVQ